MKKRPEALRTLPRVFLPGVDLSEPVELPPAEADKLRKVLRLGTGDPIAVLPDDGSLWRCRLAGKTAVPEAQEWPETEPTIALTLVQALPKPDRLETVLRMGTELGVVRFLLFPAERTVARWEPGRLEAKLARLRSIVREAAEQSYRCRLPEIAMAASLKAALESTAGTIVLSETEETSARLFDRALARFEAGEKEISLAIGPEGGWAPRERELIGDRGVTLGPRVLRTDTAGPAAAAIVLMGAYAAFCRNSLSK